jgi:hypothetical protein
MALDRRNYKQVVETTVELAQKAGASEIIGRTVNELKDEAEPYRQMVRPSRLQRLGHRQKPQGLPRRRHHLFLLRTDDGGPSHARRIWHVWGEK